MKNIIRYTFGVGIICTVMGVWGADRPSDSDIFQPGLWEAAPDSDTTSLRYPIQDRHADKYNEPNATSPLTLGDPSNITDSVEYDPVENQYNISEHIGSLFYRNPSYLTFEEFREHEFKKSTKEYWKQRASEEDDLHKKSFAPKLVINSVIFDRIFGGNTIDIRPQGSAELTFALKNQKNQNPALPERQRSVTTFDFNENIQLNVTANIGDKMKLGVNYNTQATFDFENKMKLEYTGYEDDIIKKIEAGNVTLPLNSQLIQGSQSLFGIKTQLQFGRMMVTAVFSQQKGKSQTIEVKGGAQTQKFDIKGDQYEANRHFFLSQYFREQYETALKDLNQVRSGVNITRIEVWIRNTTSIRQNDATRNLIAVSDIGETTNLVSSLTATGTYPDNNVNDLFSNALLGFIPQMRNNSGIASNQLNTIGMQNGRNYVVQENARLLSSTEYTVNEKLGYISLNSELASNQILAVAYEYTLNGQVYHVGELSTAGVVAPEALFVKLIRSTSINPSYFNWDLMMKNVYNLGGYQLKQEQFRMDVVYQDDRLGGFINYIPDGCDQVKGIPLIRVLGLDQLNANSDPQPDGVFDWKEGLTIIASNGRIYFPVLEPFGKSLRNKFCGNDAVANQFVYQALYDTTRVIAQQQAERNKFSLRGTYQSSSGSDIPLNAVNVPPGSVKVTAGGQQLKEGQDYTVDYTLGRVKIINEAYLKSNTPIQISLESQSLFNIQTKTMYGARFDYTFNKDFQLGATVLHLSERPITQKVNYGDEPIANTIIGVDGTYRKDSRFLTTLLDRLPLYSTKEISSITLSGETARLFPGHSKAVGKAGISYIDDFEGAITPLDIKNPGQWSMASTPQLQSDLFPEDSVGLVNGYNRAKFAWYYVDNLFQSETTSTPDDIDDFEKSNQYVRDIQETEIFPNKQSGTGPRSIICTNLAYYPGERGPYNYDTYGVAGVSSGMNSDGSLKDPETRWGGIMRRIETTDFQNANIEFLQFWIMDPFSDDSPNDGTGGDFYINIGDISEDILRDNQKCYENGITEANSSNPPLPGIWGKYPDPVLPQIGYNFDFDAANRERQDVGLDGINDAEEGSFYSNFLSEATTIGNTTADSAVLADPSNDNFHYFQGLTYESKELPPLERYKKYNGLEDNSPTAETVDGYRALGSQYPDYEDLNRDYTLGSEEQYLQYKLEFVPNKMVIGQNYITDIVEADLRNLPSGVIGRKVKWYQIKIPIREPSKIIGSPNLTYISAIRLFASGFTTPVILRFAKMEFLRGDWRKYDNTLLQPGEFDPLPEYPGNTTWDLSYVSIEENSNREPVNYVLPPGIERERDISTTQLANLNEQSLTMKVCELKDGDSRAAYKTTQLDIRTYKKMKMYIHAESSDALNPLSDGEMTAFIRLGGDFVDNFYEYEIPLYITQWGDNNPDRVWPESNNVEINLDQLVEVKAQRNNAMGSDPTVTLLTPYSITTTTGRRITVKGSPNLSNVRVLMIGLRNPKETGTNGRDICGEVWVNELRLSDFDEKGGWAAIARMQAKLADLGNVSLVGSHSTAGWGSLEKRVNERDKENKSAYNITTSLELGKFVPEKVGIRIPMFFEYAEEFISPQYAPLDPDVVYLDNLENAPNDSVKDALKRRSQDYTQRKSFNLTNVKKTKTGKGGGKSRIYDVENLTATYAYTEIYHRNSDIEYSLAKTYQGILGYAFNNQAKPVQPFSKSKALSSPYLKLIKDFNFYYAPSSITLRATLDRTYAETQLRNNTGLDFIIEPTFFKTYRMMRFYGFNWDLTKSLKFDFNADAEAAIDEPPGRLDTKEEKDSVKTNLKSLGRIKHYHHVANATYNIPLSKIPLTDWITASIRYSADYSWAAGPQQYYPDRDIYEVNSYANTIQNSQTISLNGNLNFSSLYNKVPFLKKLIQPKQPERGRGDMRQPRAAKPQADSTRKAQQDTTKKKNPLEPFFRGIASVVTSIKSASGTYSQTNGTLLPGFNPKPQYLGSDFNYRNDSVPNSPSSNAPGWGFIFGSQDDLRPKAARNFWITNDTSLNNPYITTKLENLSGKITAEPFKSLKIDLTFSRNYSLTHTEYFRVSGDDGTYKSFSPTETGSFTISYLTWNTSFVKDANDYSNENFRKFSEYRPSVSQLLASGNGNSAGDDPANPGYKDGYGPTQQEVLTYAFLSAYAGKSPDGKSTERFPKIPLPNWRVTYDGLSKIKLFQSFLQSFNISHGYRSTYSVNSFMQNILYNDSSPSPVVRDTIANFLPKYDFQQITISEQFSPLIGVDITFKNSLQARFEYRRDRTVSLSYASIQVTEVRGEEYSIGTGYKFKRVKLPFVRIGPAKTRIQNDLNLKADFNLRTNTTIIRKLVENANQPSAGSTTISIKLSLDYNISERINLKLFGDKQITEPFVSTTFPTSTLTAGLTIRFTLAQ